MFRLISILSLLGFIVPASEINAQAKDISLHFTLKGFIQNIDYAQNFMVVNLRPEGDIVREAVLIKNTKFVNSHNDSLTFSQFKSSDEILLEGERFREDKYTEAVKLTMIRKDEKSIHKGRIDSIVGDIAYIDGSKVKIGPGKLVKGQKKTGYENKTFSKVTELKPNDYANVDGKYDPAGFYIADNFTTAPTDDTYLDQMADTVDREYHDKFYPAWSDKSKRTKFFGKMVPGVGNITNDQVLQDYVYNLGMKLVPDRIKRNTGFVFIVVDNNDVNANMRSNGLCYIYTGLLKLLENEAQLAAILGHEISHVMYEHVSTELAKRAKAGQGKSLVGDAGKIGKNNLKGNIFRSKDKSQADSNNVMLKENLDNMSDLLNHALDRQVNTYSQDQEYQADRVGLSLMALAGYDPREAPIVWKNIYNSYGHVSEQGLKVVAKGREELTKDKQAKDKQKKSTPQKISALANLLMIWKISDYRAKSFKTHPSNLKRFDELNRLISLYWNNENDLQQSVKGDESYGEMLKRLKKKV